ncbi:putative nuclease HARBI1 [Anthonomus grandis grandis]|uniref:putative nuclease HARBI1 n=1 Tax=Anthonomus grandis grandis TaxID=2921223 RepID=UPI002165F4AE|nr:putative nuclease HARBI1 [Anthonomus grandis grandis]
MEAMDWLDEEEEMVAVNAALLVLQYKSREYWIHPINERRHEFGKYHVLWPEISNDDNRCKMYIRMTMKEFEVLYNLLETKLRKQNTNFREAISPEERLLLSLRYLATGISCKSLGFEFCTGFSTVGEIVKECCEAIWRTLQPIYMPQPDQKHWKQIARQVQENWRFPHCIGALDGKHVQIQCPNNAGSAYFNYKGTHSIVLLALVDANYKFTWIDVGNYGRNSDGGIFETSLLGQWFASNKIDVSTDKPLTPTGQVGDEAFPLKRYLMRPFSRNN